MLGTATFIYMCVFIFNRKGKSVFHKSYSGENGVWCFVACKTEAFGLCYCNWRQRANQGFLILDPK